MEARGSLGTCEDGTGRVGGSECRSADEGGGAEARGLLEQQAKRL